MLVHAAFYPQPAYMLQTHKKVRSVKMPCVFEVEGFELRKLKNDLKILYARYVLELKQPQFSQSVYWAKIMSRDTFQLEFRQPPQL